MCDLLVRHTVLQAMLPDKSDDETVTMENHHLHNVLYWQRCVYEWRVCNRAFCCIASKCVIRFLNRLLLNGYGYVVYVPEEVYTGCSVLSARAYCMAQSKATVSFNTHRTH